MTKSLDTWKILWMLLAVTVYCKAYHLKKKVCIIGAGPSGLTSLKQLSTYPKEFEPVAFERNSRIGGQWAYTDNTDFDEHGLPVHSSVYKNLKVRGAIDFMSFPDYEGSYDFHKGYLEHQQILQYLKNYTQHFDLRQYIKLNTLVEKISAYREDKWIVKTRDLNTNKRKKTLCDAVMVCNGALVKPNIPNIPGIESFPGRVLHSHTYRRPEDFINQTVVVLGARISGWDIGNDISNYAKRVYLSHREKYPLGYMEKMIEVPGVVGANGTQFLLSNGSSLTADAIVFCTGYLHEYPFFSASVNISVEKGKYVHPLYKHFINVEHPTMSIIGLIDPGLPFPIAYVQAYYFTNVLRGKVKLPSHAEMLEDSKLPPGTPVSKAHFMESETRAYYDGLAKASGAEYLSSYGYRFDEMGMKQGLTKNKWPYVIINSLEEILVTIYSRFNK